MFHLSIPISLPLPAYHPQILLRTSSPRSSFCTTQGHWVYCSCKSLDADPRLSDTVSQTLLLHQHSTFPGSTCHLCRTMSHFPAFCDFSMHPHILTHQNTCKELNKTICTQQVGYLLLRFPHELCVLLINLANSLEQVISHRVHKLPEMRQNPMRSNLLLYSIRSRSPRLFQVIQLPNIYMLNDLCFFFANVTCSPHSESIQTIFYQRYNSKRHQLQLGLSDDRQWDSFSQLNKLSLNSSMLQCSYCSAQNPTDLLLCCLALTCYSCAPSHPCTSHDAVPLNSKHPTLKMCRRCNITPISHKCIQCKKLYCKSCKVDIHQGKLLSHQIVEIDKIQKGTGTEIVCGRHDLKRNVVMENGSIGCARCGDDCGLRRIGTVDDPRRKGLKPEIMKQVLEQKKTSLQLDLTQLDSKWSTIEKSTKNIFAKLISELEERQQHTLSRINTIRSQQLSVVSELISQISIQKRSLEGIEQISHSNKDKLLKLKLASIDEGMKIVERKRKVGQYHIGKLEIESLISAIRGLVSIEKVKEDSFIDRRRSSDVLESNKKDRRSQSRDVLSRSRVSQTSQASLHQSGMKTRQNSMSRLNIPVIPNFEKKLTESIATPHIQKTRMKSDVKPLETAPEEIKKSDQQSEKFKTNFLQMKQSIRKTATYMTQRPLTRR